MGDEYGPFHISPTRAGQAWRILYCCLVYEVEHSIRSWQTSLPRTDIGNTRIFTRIRYWCCIHPAKSYKKRLHTTLKVLISTDNTHQDMKITKLWPNADWVTIWKNLQAAPVSGLDTATWYTVIHVIIPTNVRLHRIKMSPTIICKDWGSKDTTGHRLTECEEGTTTWGRTKSIIASTLRTSAANIPVEWLVRPQFRLWPPQRHRTVLWVLATCVTFRMNNRCNLTQ